MIVFFGEDLLSVYLIDHCCCSWRSTVVTITAIFLIQYMHTLARVGLTICFNISVVTGDKQNARPKSSFTVWLWHRWPSLSRWRTVDLLWMKLPNSINDWCRYRLSWNLPGVPYTSSQCFRFSQICMGMYILVYHFYLLMTYWWCWMLMSVICFFKDRLLLLIKFVHIRKKTI